MSLVFRALCWILYFPPSDITLAVDLTKRVSDAMKDLIACDIEEDNISDLNNFLKNTFEMVMEEYDRRSSGALKNRLLEEWEGARSVGNWEEESDITVKDLLKCKCPNWFKIVQGRSKNIYGVRLSVKGVWRGYCRIQTKKIKVDRTTSLAHIACIKIARTILDNNKKNQAKDWNALDREMCSMQAYINVYMNLCMELPSDLLKRLMLILEWMQWSSVTAQIHFNSFNFAGEPRLWHDLCWDYFEAILPQ